jgi:hypothetical protein
MSLLSRLAVQAARAYGILSSKSTNVPIDYLVVAGGGAGGSGVGGVAGGGGGAGGYKASTAILSTLNTYTVTVGAGGVGTTVVVGTSGSNSILSGTGLTTITSTGGGYGGKDSVAGGSGGSGGGGAYSGTAGGSGTSGQGNNGGSGSTAALSGSGGGGGGGASTTGGNGSGTVGGNGGNGTASSISGSSVTYAGGGGGSGITNGSGGSGGGAAGNWNNPGISGTANLGGGGGGGGNGAVGGNGGSGVVIISYASATPKFVGGTLTTSGGNQIHTFTSSGTLSPLTPVTASYLVVAGGGGGALGGGGAGGLLTSSTTIYSGGTYVVTVGAGGTAGTVTSTNGGQGNNSVLSGTGLTTITSTGGGYASSTGGVVGGNGGSGGGGGSGANGGTGTVGQGNNGGNGIPLNASPYSGGGGGGASVAGGNGSSTNGGSGGNGTASSISGTSVTYAGGGGGGVYLGGFTGGTAGTGGGGAGASGAAGSSGTPNTGGGGGGAGNTFNGGVGGSGTVIISYAGSQVFNGGLVTSSGGNTIHTFNATGALTPLTNNLTNSLRFRKSAPAYLSRTPASASNRKTFTWSGWVKRGEIAVSGTNDYALMCVRPSASIYTLFSLRSANAGTAPYAIVFEDSASTAVLATSNKFRDVSAWYHFVLAVDTTQATAANRVKIYVNGNQVTSFDTYNTYPTLNSDMMYNTANPHNIGRDPYDTGVQFDGYMTDINFVDGQALEPYYFGNNDANGVWKPIKYTGMYGTNGFYLTFADTSALTTSSNVGLGKDTSGNGNYWATNNISITAGTTYDAMLDVPTNTSATVANYATWNPLERTAATYSEANLKVVSTSSAAPYNMTSTIQFPTTGKWYCEVEGIKGASNPAIGMGNNIPSDQFAMYRNTGVYLNGGISGIASSGTPATWTTGDIIGIAYDASAGTLSFYKNGTLQSGGFTSIPATGYFVAVRADSASGDGGYLNCGQRPFTYTPPAGFVALNTFNLPTPTILQGNKYMDSTLYTGNGSGLTVVNAGQFKSDLVWIKNRSATYEHVLDDSVRGAGKGLFSNTTGAENASMGGFLSFNSNGWSMNGTIPDINRSGDNFVGWQWQAGQGTTSSNTSGSITSTVSVNTTAGFSVVTYTGNGTTGATIGHGLGVAPKMMIIKKRSAAGDNWRVYHASLGATKFLDLNQTSAAGTASSVWNDTAPTSTVWTVGTNGEVNTSTATYVCYAWAEIAGFSKFGSYTGNGSADGTFVYLGFRPKWIMLKITSAADSWLIIDSVRQTYNVMGPYLIPNLSDAEGTASIIDFTSNGFKLRNTGGSYNGSGSTYIYAAYAENPFKNANAR